MAVRTSNTQGKLVAGGHGAGETRVRLSNGLSATIAQNFADRVGASIPKWQLFLDQLVAGAETLPGYSQLKYSRVREIVRVQPVVAGTKLDLVCRKVTLGTLFQLLRNRMSGGVAGFLGRRAEYLIDAGVHTARPVAVISPNAAWRTEWIISEYVGDLVDLDRVALQLLATVEARDTLRVKVTILKKVVAMLIGLERNRLAHRDLKASNVLLRDWDGKAGELSLWILDLEGLKKKTYLSHSRRLQPLMRLAASLSGYSAIARTDSCRFCRYYLAQRGQPQSAWKPLFRLLQRVAKTYIRKSRQRKTHKLDGYLGDE